MLARLATFDEAAGTHKRFPALRAACERALAALAESSTLFHLHLKA
jgi:hypothetical protein